MSLKSNSIPNEYYFGDLPGTLQYTLKEDDIKGLEVPDNDDLRGFNIDYHTLDNKLRVIPNTTSGNKNEWKLILIMKKETDDGEIWLKAALRNTTTQEIALMTSTNSSDNLTKRGNRYCVSHDPDWYIGRYRMSAPAIFWKELINRLTH